MNNLENLQCCYCNRIFMDKFQRDRHLLIHTGIKPYQCPFCMYKASRKDSVDRHIKCKHRLWITDCTLVFYLFLWHFSIVFVSSYSHYNRTWLRNKEFPTMLLQLILSHSRFYLCTYKLIIIYYLSFVQERLILL